MNIFVLNTGRCCKTAKNITPTTKKKHPKGNFSPIALNLTALNLLLVVIRNIHFFN